MLISRGNNGVIVIARNFKSKLEKGIQHISVIMPYVEKAITGLLVQKTFEAQKGVDITLVQNMIEPSEVGYSQNKEDEITKNRAIGIPEEWKRPEFKEKIKSFIENGIEEVLKGDLLILTGGRDYTPELLGNDRKKHTQDYSVFDARDIVETYMLMTAIANGKTVHATCRGYQVLTSNMIQTFAPESGVEIVQHLPKYLSKHSGKNHSIHHAGGNLSPGFSELITEKDWFEPIMKAQLEGKKPIFASFEGGSHMIHVTENSLLKDALLIAKKIGGRDIVNIDGIISTPMSSLHHQGFATDTKEGAKLLKRALSAAGGTKSAISADPKDRFVEVVEAVTFSKHIGLKEIEQINNRVAFVNNLMGLDIKIPTPDLEVNKTIRFDAPHATQPHPELNIAGVALIIPSLTVAYAKDKEHAKKEGRDIGGYNEWSMAKGEKALFEIYQDSIKREIS